MVINNALGLDIGEKRIGVARVNMIARVPEPLATLANDDSFAVRLEQLIGEYDPDVLVVGLPRNLNGQETAQSAYVKAFSQEKLIYCKVPIVFQDETLSSRAAEERLQEGGSGKKADIDAMAAAIILEDYLKSL